MRYSKLLPLAFITLSAQAANTMDVTFFFGPSLAQSGKIQDLGDPNFNTAFSFNYFFSEKHGLGVSWGNEFDFEGTSKQPSLKDASMHTFELHYAFRYRQDGSKFRWGFQPGIGIQTLYDESQDYYWGYTYYDDISSAWIFNYKLLVDYSLAQWGDGNNFFIGAALSQVFSYNDDLNGRDISGSRLSGLAQLGVEF